MTLANPNENILNQST